MLFHSLIPTCPVPTTASAAALSAAVRFDDIFDGPSANGAASVGHLLELQPARIAETHVSAGVNDRVYHVLVADGAFISPGPRDGRGDGRLRQADGRVGRCA